MDKVFISYSHDSEEHKRNVLILSDKLIDLGVNTSLDQYNNNPQEGWPRWMAKELRESKRILIICSKNYYEKACGNVPNEVGKGGKFEAHLILDQFYQSGSINFKILPILINNEKESSIPDYLRSYTYYKISDFDNLENDQGFKNLYRELTGQPLILKPKLGVKKVLATGINLNSKGEEKEIENVSIELTINKPFDTFSKSDQKRILTVISEVLTMDEKDIKVIRKYRGSVILHLSLPKTKAMELEEIVNRGKLLDEKIMDVVLIKEFKEISSQKVFGATQKAVPLFRGGFKRVEAKRIEYYIREKFKKEAIGRIIIGKKVNRLSVTIYTTSPSMLFVDSEVKIDHIIKEIRKRTGNDVIIKIKKIKHQALHASLVAQSIGNQIEKGADYKRVIQIAMKSTIQAGATGIEVRVKRRLDGSDNEIREVYHEGRISRYKYNSKANYFLLNAFSVNGIKSIKVWIYDRKFLNDEYFSSYSDIPKQHKGKSKRGRKKNIDDNEKG